ncbi:methylenetetrahydrofolate reductase [Candidatus Woesearchaeota archaeon]|nr:methylenetetrahydrofolate reductase [Candidatus Woesearchaeota archaeon]
MKAKKVTEILKEKSFTFSVELVPPRNGTPLNEIYDKIEDLKGKVDFISVTKGAGGSLRGGTLPITYFAQEKHGLTAISHFVCRERTKQEIENDLTDMNYFGIRNILALRGDPPAGTKEPWEGDYRYAYLLVKQLHDLNNGVYLPTPLKQEPRKGEKCDFCILAAGHPEDPFEEEKVHIKSKVDAGAEAIITQMIFSFEDYKTYVENLKSAGINVPVLAGIRPIVNYKQAKSVENFFGIPVPKELKEELEKLEDDPAKSRAFGVSYFADMIKKLKEYGCPGVHLFILQDFPIVDDIIQKLK